MTSEATTAVKEPGAVTLSAVDGADTKLSQFNCGATTARRNHGSVTPQRHTATRRTVTPALARAHHGSTDTLQRRVGVRAHVADGESQGIFRAVGDHDALSPELREDGGY
jgi:hypothetical protein